jgi:hypothetical protein
MPCRTLFSVALFTSVCTFSCSENASRPPEVEAVAATPPQVSSANELEGVWSGSWGGGDSGDGTVIQPVIAELLLVGDQVEMSGFRTAGIVRGTARLDAAGKKLHVTPAPDSRGGAPAPLMFDYERAGNSLTLTDQEGYPISVDRQDMTRTPRANQTIELVSATAINEAGELVVTEFVEHRMGSIRAAFFSPMPRNFKLDRATIFIVDDATTRRLTLDEARPILKPETMIALAFRSADRIAFDPPSSLVREIGPPPPDAEAAAQTFARTLRPGTLLFVLPAEEAVPQP